MIYDFTAIEKKWQNYWEEHHTYFCDTSDLKRKKYYVLDMFPYPSGQGLHVGHPEGYTATDIVARMKRMQGYNVLHPMGFDSFGLPAEQYAIKTGNHPEGFTLKNIENFKRQLKMLGFSYDWSKTISTCDPKYYRWTQWIFKQLYLDGYAKYVEMPVNWCEELGTVLANDEVVDGKSERGGYPVIRKKMKQWVLDIPRYAEALLSGLDKLDWPESTKEIQRNWIGKSEGALVRFAVAGTDESFDVFTTRCDTLFGATYCVLSPEHALVKKIADPNRAEEVDAYIAAAMKKSELERTDLSKEKTGMFTGAYALNPVNGKKIPIYISDYVLSTYGTGAIMAVPAHDERDYAFAQKFHLEILPVLSGGDVRKEAFTGDGVHIHSEFLDGLNKEEAIEKMLAYLEEHHLGKRKVNYKLREWIFARQRYWGEPIPIVYDEEGNSIVLKDEDLPLILPKLDNYGRGKDGSLPLERAEEWMNLVYDGKKVRRESATMPGSAGSSWYYLRYIDPDNDRELASYEKLKHWMPVDLYIGGSEHAVGHLLYARFWNRYLYDKGIVPCAEPFQKLFHQGMILGENGEKMSKSRGNVVNPDDVVKNYGADALRLYEMFMGPLEASLPWSTGGLDGAKRFIERVVRILDSEKIALTDSSDGKLDYAYHFLVKKVSEDFENLQFNTAISQMMIFVNEVYKNGAICRDHLEGLIKMFSCICPHIGEELWQSLGHEGIIDFENWPTYDPAKLVLDEVEIAVQVNGKLRATLTCPLNEDAEKVKERALRLESVKARLEGLNVVKVIVVPNKIVNIVAR